MKMFASSDIFLFGDFRFDRAGGGLFRRDDHGAFAPVAIGCRALDLLAVLIERRGDVVSKEEIMAAVWPKTAVEEANLFAQISALRAILDKRAIGPKLHPDGHRARLSLHRASSSVRSGHGFFSYSA